MTYRYLIVGGGMTADAAAKAVHASDGTGSIVLISSEPDAPYKRPPLSKGLWTGSSVDKTDLRTSTSDADVILGRTAVALDVDGRSVRLDDDRTIHFEYALLATGASARSLPDLPAGGPVVAYRTLADYRTALARTKPGSRVLVVGGGFIGSELAAGLNRAGAEVHMVFPEPAIGAPRFPSDLAAAITSDYVDRGVHVHANGGVSGAHIEENGANVTLNDGTTLSVDLVAVGVGTKPNDELAAAAGLVTGNGIHVDAFLRTQRQGVSDGSEAVGHVFAAGDVAAFPWPSPLTAGRIEHEDNAVMMGGHAGRQMASAHQRGLPGSAAGSALSPYLHLPFFYSDLFDNGYEAVGVLDSRLDMVEDWHDGLKAGVVYYLSNRKVVGVLLWNTWGQVDAARELVHADATVDPARLAGRLMP